MKPVLLVDTNKQHSIMQTEKPVADYIFGLEPIRGVPKAEDLSGSDPSLPRIVTYSDRWDARVWRMLRSARLSGWVPGRADRPIVVGYGQPFGGFVDLKVTKTLQAIKDLPDEQILLLIDGSDILVTVSPEKMADIHASFSAPVVVSSNPDCKWNGGGLSRSHPNCVNLNAGAFMGPAGAIRKALQAVKIANHDDLDCKQDDQCRWYAAFHSLTKSGLIELDSDSRLFSSVSAKHHKALFQDTLYSGLASRVPVLHIPATSDRDTKESFRKAGHDSVASSRIPAWNEPEDPIKFVPAWPSDPSSPAAVVIILDNAMSSQGVGFSKEAHDLGMSYTVVSGIRPQRIDPDCPRMSKWVRSPKDAGAGCTLAHLRIHEAVAAGAPGTENGVIIFESDATFPCSGEKMNSTIKDAKAAGLNMLLLGTCAMKSAKYEPIPSSGSHTHLFFLNDNKRDISCTHAYWSNKSGSAQMIAARNSRRKLPIDAQFDLIKPSGLVLPNLAYQNIQAYGTSQGYNKNLFVMANPYSCVIDGKTQSKYVSKQALIWYIAAVISLIALAFGLGVFLCRWRK